MSKQVHELKTVNPHFENVFMGRKTFECRKNDRDFRVNDMLILKEYDPSIDRFTGREMRRHISHILTHEQFPQGIQEGYCIISIL